MKVKNIKNTSNDTSKSGLSYAELARRIINDKKGHIVLTKQDIKGKDGAHVIEQRSKEKMFAITTPKNNNVNNTGYYGVRYAVPFNKIKKLDNQLAKKNK